MPAELTAADAARLLAESTPGPWYISPAGSQCDIDSDATYPGDPGDDGSGWTVAEACGHPRWERADARLIAAAPDLARTVIRLEAERAELRETVDQIAEHVGAKTRGATHAFALLLRDEVRLFANSRTRERDEARAEVERLRLANGFDESRDLDRTLRDVLARWGADSATKRAEIERLRGIIHQVGYSCRECRSDTGAVFLGDGLVASIHAALP